MGDASAYESLGISPGADQAAIERAYKKLIKEHHPDREGGDSARAAEINRAYRELRFRKPADGGALELNDHWGEQRWRFGWMIPGLAAVGALVASIWTVLPISDKWQDWVPTSALASPAKLAASTAPDAMAAPLHVAAIAAAVEDARHLGTTRDEMSLAAQSSDCHHRLRSDPNVAQLDRCAAFDDAVVVLQDRDPLRDRGPFSELAVTARQWNSASALSSDYLAIDGRLDRIRMEVELALADTNPELGQD